jgi:16S rRNA (cytosine967-C5)-methyltransferase
VAVLGAEQRAHGEDALARFSPLQAVDRGQAWFLALGVLRRRGSIDAALRPWLSMPIGGLDPEVRVALRIGAFEHLVARTPNHAAVSQAVELVRALGAGRAHGVVNAVLRRLQPPAKLSRSESLELPTWLVSRWDARFGPEAVERWARACAEPPGIAIVARDPAASPGAVMPGSELAPAGIGEPASQGVFRLPEGVGAIPALPGFSEGKWWVQDPAAVAVADLVPIGTVLDACAAPGGKSFRMASRGSAVTAVDRAGDRLARVAEGAKRLNLPVQTVRHDWTSGMLPGEPLFDAVLVDAPCSGLGTIRRHPEIKWRRVEPDLREAAELQRAILDVASRHVRPGGALVYAVCSPEPEEGRDVIEAFLAGHPGFTLERTWSSIPPVGEEDAHFAGRMFLGR